MGTQPVLAQGGDPLEPPLYFATGATPAGDTHR
jgi:hypothetical protein